jgi:radical SAM enzyme (TIGR01210 family)
VQVSDGVSATAVYPAGRAARDRFVLDRRGPRRAVDPWAPPRATIDREPDGHGSVVDVGTLFLTGRECPWRCVMCDLWRDTIETDTPPGAIPHQIELGLRSPMLATVRHLKLYNAGSFFDDRAVPPGDDPAIARAVAGVTRLTVESHPRLVGDRTWRFRDRLAPSLEVAMGLETAHPDALARLNKGCTLDDFAAAARALAAHGVGLRVFLLVHPPFVPHDDRTPWLLRSIDAAIDAGAAVITLIPTRADTGAMEALTAEGLFAAPSLATLEEAAGQAIRHAAGRARVLADLWDLPAFATCPACLDARRARLLRLNLEQRVPECVACAACAASDTLPA